MCGICGTFLDPQRPSQGEAGIVKRMMQALEHRGPDEEGMKSGRGFCLGHRRLSIIDLKSGKQPMTARGGRKHLVFNGEIYNYIELRDSLKKRGAHFSTMSDTEVSRVLDVSASRSWLDAWSPVACFCVRSAAAAGVATSKAARRMAAQDGNAARMSRMGHVEERFIG